MGLTGESLKAKGIHPSGANFCVRDRSSRAQRRMERSVIIPRSTDASVGTRSSSG